MDKMISGILRYNGTLEFSVFLHVCELVRSDVHNSVSDMQPPMEGIRGIVRIDVREAGRG